MTRRLPDSVRKARAKDAMGKWRVKIGRERITLADAKKLGVPLPQGTPQFLCKNGFIKKVKTIDILSNSKWIYLNHQHYEITEKGIKYGLDSINNR